MNQKSCNWKKKKIAIYYPVKSVFLDLTSGHHLASRAKKKTKQLIGSEFCKIRLDPVSMEK